MRVILGSKMPVSLLHVFSFLYLNIQGVGDKLDIVEDLIINKSCDFVCLSEHWVNSDDITLMSLSGFKLATYYQRNVYSRGGTLIFVSDKWDFDKYDLSAYCMDKHFEACAIVLKEHKLVVVCLYHTPDGDECLFLSKLEQLLVDFNQPKWFSYTIVVGGDVNAKFDVTRKSKSVECFANVLKQHNFYCHNNKPTRGSACLDNVFSNANKGACFAYVEPFYFSDHSSLWFHLMVEGHVHGKRGKPERKVKRRTFSDDNVAVFSHELSLIDWNNHFNSELLDKPASNVHGQAERVFNKFISVLCHVFNGCFPLNIVKEKNVDTNKKPWYNKDIAKLKQELVAAYDIFEMTKEEAERLNYITLKRTYKNSIRQAKLDYNSGRIERSSNKCKTAWSVINGIRQKGERADIPVDPDTFSSFFVDSVSMVSQNIDVSKVRSEEYLKNTPTTSNQLSFHPVKVGDVIKVISELSNSKAQDYYELSNYVMKGVKEMVAYPLTVVFNMCLDEGIFPELLKISKVTPIFKKGNKLDPANYRPVSLVPIIAKVFEHLLFQQVYTYFEVNKLFTRSQFGFRKSLCTIDAIKALVSKIQEVFENRGFAWVTFCDLSKAFDCVDHELLLYKLQYYGITGVTCKLFQSYLANRKQVICVNGRWSAQASVSCGVPQGSVLGPFLFLISINDLPDCINTETYLYADDSTFLMHAIDFKELNDKVEHAMANACDWFSSNHFLLNKDKTVNVIFKLRNMPDNEVVCSEQVKFLGMVLDDRLSWSPHIDSLLPRLSKTVFLLSRLMYYIPVNYVKSAYYALFQSVISYGLICYGSSPRIKEILLFQKKIVRYMTKSNAMEHCKPLFVKLEILTIANLYIFQVLVNIFKNKENYSCRMDLHVRQTRYKSRLDLPRVRLEKSRTGHNIMGIRLFNKLPPYVCSLDFKTFKSGLYSFLINNPMYDIREFFDLSETAFTELAAGQE